MVVPCHRHQGRPEEQDEAITGDESNTGLTRGFTHPVAALLNFALLTDSDPTPSNPDAGLAAPGGLTRPVPLGSTSSCSNGF